jgi:hypothetical protein
MNDITKERILIIEHAIYVLYLEVLFFLFQYLHPDWHISKYCIQHFSSLSEDAGIGPRTVAEFALTVRAANHARLCLLHCKKKLAVFLPPAEMSITKLSLDRNN